MKTLKIGIVGGGGMGKVHYANWKAIEGIEIVALCDNAPNAPATAQEWGVPLYASITEMVQSSGLNVVDICTPTFLHHDMVMESLNLGIDTICEKPIALNYADAKEMLDTAEAKGCHLYIAQVLQFTKEIQALHKLVETEEYGKVLDASFERLSAAPRLIITATGVDLATVITGIINALKTLNLIEINASIIATITPNIKLEKILRREDRIVM